MHRNGGIDPDLGTRLEKKGGNKPGRATRLSVPIRAMNRSFYARSSGWQPHHGWPAAHPQPSAAQHPSSGAASKHRASSAHLWMPAPYIQGCIPVPARLWRLRSSSSPHVRS